MNILFSTIVLFFFGLIFFKLVWNDFNTELELLVKIKILIFSFLGGLISFSLNFTIIDVLFSKRIFLENTLLVTFINDFSIITTTFVFYYFLKKYFDDLFNCIVIILGIGIFFSAFNLIYLNILVNYFALLEGIAFEFSFLEDVFIYFFYFLFLAQIYKMLYFALAFYIHMNIRSNYIGLSIAITIQFIFSIIFSTIVSIDILINYTEMKMLLVFLAIICIVVLGLNYHNINKYIYFKFRKNILINIQDSKSLNKNLFLFCSKCDLPQKTEGFSFRTIKYGFCPNCKNLITENFLQILQLNYKDYNELNYNYDFFKDRERLYFLDENKKVVFNTKRHYLSADLESLNKYIVDFVKSEQNELNTTKINLKLLKILGFKNL